MFLSNHVLFFYLTVIIFLKLDSNHVIKVVLFHQVGLMIWMGRQMGQQKIIKKRNGEMGNSKKRQGTNK